jgi:two-component system response regulator VicR
MVFLATKILLVDDEPLIIKGLKYTLENDGYETAVAYDGEQALEVFQKEDIDLILLDVMLPKMDGIEVCQRIREKSNVPIIMLTAKGEDIDKILGLEYGADDYMTKPFNIVEVKMRIKNILRRTQQFAPADDNNIYRSGDLEVNVRNRSVMLSGKEVRLTAKEFDLVLMFIANPGRVYTREEILDSVWKNDYSGDARTVDVHIRRLREKIEQNPAQPEYIFTKWGVGYYFTNREN